ncbi:ATP-binding protein [Lentimicrobium sp. S6]|uniref:AAA family ATPase n=1 Tax=Lentimicrobium sp. S6 TaxID=2735872 RepID=UPI001557D982|nr:ATP-binding protein [Lentimicrobium sp. S6]NPD45711.1 ATP-binding protein [Lentimicrobium sp. S6]
MLHLIIGNTGAGKTTYALQLKAQNKGLIFSIDKWNNTLFFQDKTEGDGVEWILERIERAENMMMDTILQLENAEVDSILDLGLSKFEHREKWRQFAKEHDFKYQIHYLNIDKETRRKRVTKRNQEQGDSFEFEVSAEAFDFMETWFEAPRSEELVGAIVVR